MPPVQEQTSPSVHNALFTNSTTPWPLLPLICISVIGSIPSSRPLERPKIQRLSSYFLALTFYWKWRRVKLHGFWKIVYVGRSNSLQLVRAVIDAVVPQVSFIPYTRPPKIKLTWKRSHLQVVSLVAVFSITALRDDAKNSSDGREYTSSSSTLCGCSSQTLNDCDDWFATMPFLRRPYARLASTVQFQLGFKLQFISP